MGRLRCLYERHGRKKLSGYKKRFWVVNEASSHLEVYKNDQAHVPLDIVKAEDIRGVMYSGDKQNRFYVMTVQTRKRYDIKFRMNSSEEREKWSAAVTKLMERYSTSNRRRAVLVTVMRRTRAASKSLGVSISVDAARLLTDVPDDLQQYVLEAVDIALGNISVMVRSYGSELEVPKNYTLSVQASNSGVRSGPQYDPMKRSVVVHVVLFRDTLNHVQFSATEPDEVLMLIQSNVFRNPMIEGWIESDPACSEVCAEIKEVLEFKGNLAFTFQWGQHMTDTVKVEAYLRRFVDAAFFRGILRAVNETIISMTHLIEDAVAPVSTTTPSVTPRPATSRASHGATSMERTASYLAVAAASGTVNTAEIRALAVRLLADNITGFSIRLEKRVVESCSEPPYVVVSNTVEYEQRCRPGFLLAAKYRQAFSQPLSRGNGLQDRLFEVSYHAYLSQQVNAMRSRLNVVFDKRVKVSVLWDTLFSTFQALSVRLFPRELPRLVHILADVYVYRLQNTAHMLADTTVVGNAYSTFYEVFCSCVDTISVNFAAFNPQTAASSPPPQPTVRNGIFTDHMLCADETHSTELLSSVNQVRGSSARQMPLIVEGVCVCASTPKLGSWLETYFSAPEHNVACPRRVLEDEFDSDSDVGTAEQGDIDYGEAVANERSAEIQVLNLQRVLNIVYDSQGQAVDLKIGADDIRHAICSLSGAFKGRHISKHDLARVLTVNLQRLRNLYSRSVEGETSSLLTEPQAIQLLRDFCEYEENEFDIVPELQKRALILPTTFAEGAPHGSGGEGSPARRATLISTQQLLRRDSAGTMSPANLLTTIGNDTNQQAVRSPTGVGISSASGTEGTRVYDYATVTNVALNLLLPREAVMARKAWRAGFLFGLTNTGKTLITNCMRGIARATVATVGLSQTVVPFEQWVLSLHELGGRDSFRKNWKYYATRMERVDFLMFVVDSQNRRVFHEAHSYLKEVTEHFSHVPLLIVYNNYRDLPRPVLLSELNEGIGLHKIRSANPRQEVHACTCDLTIVYSANRVIPPSLLGCLHDLSAELLACSPTDNIPSVPKRADEVQPSARRPAPPPPQASSSASLTAVPSAATVPPTAGGTLPAPAAATGRVSSPLPSAEDTSRAATLDSNATIVEREIVVPTPRPPQQ